VALSIFNDYVGTSGSMSGIGDVGMARFLGDVQNKTIAIPAAFTSPVAMAPTGTSQARGRTRG
jgi:hypothetical protein